MMNYKTEITTNSDLETSFFGVTKNIDKWWGKVDKPISKIGDEFSIYFGKTEWKFEITEFELFSYISWKCINAKHFHNELTGIKEEWLNTELTWKFDRESDKTKITFSHNGLTPNLNCYDVCKSGWDFFIPVSLKNYLETGKGSPHFD